MRYAIWLLAAVLGMTALASADTTTSTLKVTSSVSANCVVRSPLGLDFGTYGSATKNGSPLDATAPVLTVNCTKGAPGVNIALDNGESFTGSHRNLRSGNDLVAYEVYTGPDHGTAWNMTQTLAYVPTGTPTNVSVYARVLPVEKHPPAGHYTDVLMAMVNF